MHYNVENLFDAQHDQGKDDWEFLPANFPGRKEACSQKPAPWMVEACMATDWTDQKFEMKLEQIKKVFQSSGTQRPDMMSVVEIENDAVVQRLATKLGFKEFVVTQSPDERGIDVALMFNQKPNLRLVKAEKIPIPPKLNPKPTRDILKVTFKVGAKNLIVYVNHWPSQGAPAPVRKVVAEVMMASASEEMKNGNAVIAMGDFNVISEDRPDPFYEVVNNRTRPFFLLDVHSTLREEAKNLNVDMSSYPAGTYFFASGFSWNLLDHFFVSPDMLKTGGIAVDLKSYQILNPPFLTAPMTIRKGPQAGSVIVGTPHAYNHNATNPNDVGFSDHFAILLNLMVP
jgi:endonuclease/exonuclease/phosphatase family metal-dependent hydrolase